MAPPQETFVSGEWHGAPAEFRRDRMIVSVSSTAPLQPTLDAVKADLAQQVEGLTVHNPPGRSWAVLQFQALPDAATRIPQLAEQLAARPELRYAEPDFVCRAHAITNDPLYTKQWWPQKIAIEDLWRITQGSDRVLLAILDSGISMPDGGAPDHEDMSGPRYIVGTTLDGFPVPHDYTQEITYPYWPFIAPHPPRDLLPHGTHVTGIAAAVTNNGRGVSGANWRSDVYVARVLDEHGNGSASMVKFAVHDVLRFMNQSWFLIAQFFPWHYQRVVFNLSLGFKTEAQSMLELCEETSGKKIVICTAAASRGAGDALEYPAAFARNFEHVFAVGATDQDDHIDSPKLENYSAITIFAPGVEILSTTPTYACTETDVALMYASKTGTSQACPIVAGAVSLLWSARRSLTPGQIRSGLISAARPCYDDYGGQHPRIHLGRRSRAWSFHPRLPWE